MAQQIINIGTAPNDGTGDPLRDSQQKANANFTELYSLITTGGGGVYRQQNFVYNGGVQEFTPVGGIAVIMGVYVNGVRWIENVGYTFDTTKVTLIYPLPDPIAEGVSNVTIDYSPTPVGIQTSYTKFESDARYTREIKFFAGGNITQNTVLGNNYQEYLVRNYKLKKITVVFGQQSMNVNKTIPFAISVIDTNSAAPAATLVYTANCSAVVGLVENKVYTFDMDVSLNSGKLLTVSTGAFTASTQVLNNCMVTLILEEV